jgi:hypothetical protein
VVPTARSTVSDQFHTIPELTGVNLEPHVLEGQLLIALMSMTGDDSVVVTLKFIWSLSQEELVGGRLKYPTAFPA